MTADETRCRLRSLAFLCWVFSAVTCQAQSAPADAIEISVDSDNAKRSIVPGGGLDESQSFRDCPECPQMVAVPAGSFMMGSRYDLDSFERPLHRVTVAKPFAIGMFNVTFAEWDACVADGTCAGQPPSDKGWGRGDMPLLNVTWDAAHAYTQWLSRKTRTLPLAQRSGVGICRTRHNNRLLVGR